MANTQITVDEAADRIAEALDIDPESVLVSGTSHVLLTPDQVVQLLESR